MISPQALQEFKQLYKQQYGIELDDRTALHKAQKLMVLIKAIYHPLPKDSHFLKGGMNGTKTKGKS